MYSEWYETILMKVPNHNYLWFNFRNVLHCLIDCWYIQEVRTRCHTFWSKKHISFAKFVNVNCFSDRNSDWNSWRNSGTLGEFWNPGRILEELWENSGEILKEFWRNSGRIPWSSVFFSNAVVQNSTFDKNSWLPNSSGIL